MPQTLFAPPFQIDHIVAEKHGGETGASNLALACPHCNLYKVPKIAGLDPASGQVMRLFHPRTDIWSEHFAWQEAHLTGSSTLGRVTIQVLAINVKDFLQFRSGLWKEGFYLP